MGFVDDSLFPFAMLWVPDLRDAVDAGSHFVFSLDSSPVPFVGFPALRQGFQTQMFPLCRFWQQSQIGGSVYFEGIISGFHGAWLSTFARMG